MPKLFTTKELCLCGLNVVLIVIMSLISIPIPLSPVPISLGVLGIFICGAILNTKCAVLSTVAYLMLGAIGLPVFVGFKGGLGVLAGATGGYLWAYPLMAFIISFFSSLFIKSGVSSNEKNNFKKLIPYFILTALLLIAMLVCYTIGTLWLAKFLNINIFKALTLGVYPYVPVDIIKIVFCVAVILPIKKTLIKSNLL